MILIVASLVASFVAAITIFVMLIHLREVRFRRYDMERSRADIDIVRKSLEEQIYRLTDRLTSTDRKWQDVNHLLVAGQQTKSKSEPEYDTKKVPKLEFLVRSGINAIDLTVDRTFVFVLIPFHPDFDPLYAVIKDACQKVGLVCQRGDEEHIAVGSLLSHILKLIVKARVVIAVVDGRNPNVFYELGVAHSLSKSVLIVAKSAEDIPFDVRSNQILFYSDNAQLSAKLLPELTKVFVSD